MMISNYISPGQIYTVKGLFHYEGDVLLQYITCLSDFLFIRLFSQHPVALFDTPRTEIPGVTGKGILDTINLEADGGFIVEDCTDSYLGGSTDSQLIYLNDTGDTLRAKAFASNIETII
ncbi:MAG: hypothetical protein JSU77_09250 [Fidelibacterota bacterium]|nr:MAG: hypothetical protein JSU77_09250 [Candidatus Neomarinimicrobiota bacterium]